MESKEYLDGDREGTSGLRGNILMEREHLDGEEGIS